MSRRHRRSRPEVTTRTAPAPSTTTATPIVVDSLVAAPTTDADALHRRAVAIRESRLGRGPTVPASETPLTTQAPAVVTATYPVKGMTCRTCEVRINRHVSRLPGVRSVEASAARAQVTIESTGPVPVAAIDRALSDAGYALGRTPWVERDPRIWATAGVGILVVAAIALVASVSGVGDLGSRAGELSRGGLLVALLLGLAAGVSTCMALVGGLVLGLSAAFQAGRPAAATGAQIRPAAVFVAGRVIGYAAFGAVLGAIGASFTMPPALTAVLMLAVAGVMLILGTRLTGLSPRAAGWSPTLPLALGRSLGVAGDAGPGAYGDGRAALLGAATFFLPCGFTQAVQIYALSTGSPVFAAALLGTFALGTAPGLLALAGLPLVVPIRARPTLLRLAGVVVIGFALLNGAAGLRLAGLDIPSPVGSASAVDATPRATAATSGQAAAARQELRTYQDDRGYGPAVATIAAGVPTAWHVDSRSPYSCATHIVVPDLGIEEQLAPGDNVIQLPALSAGTLDYTCGMGMYSGRIVIESPGGAG